MRLKMACQIAIHPALASSLRSAIRARNMSTYELLRDSFRSIWPDTSPVELTMLVMAPALSAAFHRIWRSLPCGRHLSLLPVPIVLLDVPCPNSFVEAGVRLIRAECEGCGSENGLRGIRSDTKAPGTRPYLWVGNLFSPLLANADEKGAS